MASLQLVNEALGKVVTFLAPLMPLIGCHMVDFLTLRHWDTLLSSQLQHDLLSLPADALHLLPSASLPYSPDHTNEDDAKPWDISSSDLPAFLSQVCKHCPAALGVTTPTEQILDYYGSAEISVLPMKGVMSHKKTHEVEVMGQVIARLVKGLGVAWLVDLGSGRGYLSTSLVLQYGQRVVAIDSSSSNTTSALARNTKLKRLWDNLRQTWQDREEGRRVRKGKTRKKKVITQQDSTSLPAHLNGCFFGVTKFITEDTDLLELVRNAVDSEKVKSEDGNAVVRNSSCSLSEKVICGSKKQPGEFEDTADLSSHPHNTVKGQTHTATSTKDTNTRKQVQDSPMADTTCVVDETSLLGLVGLHTCGNLASSSLRLFAVNPRVNFLCNVGCCYHLLEEEFSRNTYNQRKIPDGAELCGSPVHIEGNCVSQPAGEEHLLTLIQQEGNCSQSSTSHDEQQGNTGFTRSPHKREESVILHSTEEEACLAPSRQFSNTREELWKDPPPPLLQAHSEAATTEGQGEGDIDPLHPSRIPNLGYGFPLSSFLRRRKFSLGRNSRMLSSQAADRLTRGNIGGPDSLYWRALLQVVLKDKLGDVSELSHVGRLSAKCHSFTEYARTAMTRLGVSIDVTEEELEEYNQKYSSNKDKLERFFLLRASLAAVVEGAMLLDRLAFLCEQEDVSAFLVPMFDPVTSPRSHALIAVRNTSRLRL